MGAREVQPDTLASLFLLCQEGLLFSCTMVSNQQVVWEGELLPGCSAGTSEANRRGSDCPERVSAVDNWDP